MDLLKKYFPQITEFQVEKLILFKDLIKQWNKKINLVSRKDVENFEVNHILHSLSISKFIKFKKDTQILDLGTGGGLPGIPLSIVFPNSNFKLIDRKNKKINVLNEIINKLSINNVKAQNIDIIDLNHNYDFIINRAVSSTDNLIKLCNGRINFKGHNEIKNGIICLKGGNLNSELKNINKFQIVELKYFFSEFFFEKKKILYIPNPYNHMDN
jgi:16S rRNA (guanine527-N7)-methyltransferase